MISGIRASLLVLGLTMQAWAAVPSVSNIVASQRAGSKIVDISYDVSSSVTNVVTISVVVSNATGTLSAAHVSGDIGAGVATGTGKKIVWDGGADQNGQNLINLRVCITASAGSGSGAPPAGMVAVPAGTFTMGLSGICTPLHTVELSAFYMDRTEVNKGAWDEVAAWAAANGYSTGNASGKAASHPAHSMKWHSAVKWCNARSEREGLTPCYTNANGSTFKTGDFAGGCNWSANGYRLPTEAEWEFAARGTGTTNHFPWTDNNEIQHARANYWSSSVLSFDTSPTRGYHPAYTNGTMPYTSPVGSFTTNAYGLYDMSGNVYEWCWDWFASYSTTPVVNPRGPSTGSSRVIRGGSWGGAYPANAYQCDVAYRNYSTPDGAANNQGFRCVKAMPLSDAGAAASAPFSADFRDYTLTVASAYGAPTPSVGSMNFAWHATVTGSVQSVVSASGTNLTCAGWTGTGSMPVSGTATNTGAVVLTNLTSSLTWLWTVSAFKPSISVQPQSRTNTYATTALLSVVATGMPTVVYQWRCNGTNLVNGSRVSGAASNTLTLANTQLSDAGNYTVVVSNSMGCVTSQVAVLTMKKALLSVTADAKSKTYKTVNPPLTATISGFVNNETSAVLSGAPALSTTAALNSNAGAYPITAAPGTLAAANYSFTFVNGTLTVNKANQQISFGGLPHVTTREQNLELGASASSGLPVIYSSENPSVATVSNDLAVIASAGSTTIAATQPGNENYLPAPTATQTLVVVPLTGFELWAEDQGLSGDLATLFNQDSNNDGVPNGFEFAFGTNRAPGTVILALRMINGHPVVEIPQQDGATLPYVDVWVKGCTNLACGPDGWTLAVVPATDTTGKPADRAWFETTTAPASAFFKLEAALK